MSKSLLSALLFLVVAISACRSSDKKDEGSQVKNEDSASESAAAAPKADGECAQKPEPVICCEALTPSCNQCRDNAKKALADWAAKCAKPTPVAKDCSSPPVSDCCSESTDACRQCREAAITTLVDWKERCAAMEAYPCDKKPPQAECGTSRAPSANACRDRNRRLMEDWERRCK